MFLWGSLKTWLYRKIYITETVLAEEVETPFVAVKEAVVSAYETQWV